MPSVARHVAAGVWAGAAAMAQSLISGCVPEYRHVRVSHVECERRTLSRVVARRIIRGHRPALSGTPSAPALCRTTTCSPCRGTRRPGSSSCRPRLRGAHPSSSPTRRATTPPPTGRCSSMTSARPLRSIHRCPQSPLRSAGPTAPALRPASLPLHSAPCVAPRHALLRLRCICNRTAANSGSACCARHRRADPGDAAAAGRADARDLRLGHADARGCGVRGYAV